MINQDALSRFGRDEDLMVGLLGFLALPRKLCHCAKQAASTLGRQHLGKLLWNLAVDGKLFELWKGKVTKVVMPSHELSLFISGQELNILVVPMEITFMDTEDKDKKYCTFILLRYIYSNPFRFPISSLGLPNIPSQES